MHGATGPRVSNTSAAAWQYASALFYPLEKPAKGHPRLGLGLKALSRLAASRQDDVSILSFHLRRLETAERLFPRDQYHEGHSVLAACLDFCGGALFSHEDYGGAATYYRRSLEIKERLYPPDRYPRGHTEVATALSNLGTALDLQNEFTQSLNALQASLQMLERLYPSSEFPQGHADLVAALAKVGIVYKDVKSLDQALAYYQQALEMKERIYPKDEFPKGHDCLINCLIETAKVQARQEGRRRSPEPPQSGGEMYDRTPASAGPITWREWQTLDGILLSAGETFWPPRSVENSDPRHWNTIVGSPRSTSNFTRRIGIRTVTPTRRWYCTTSACFTRPGVSSTLPWRRSNGP